uniref:Uncharacterized protein n=1 Tax=Anguilla anguilla TaxID=7936 RepID=A0A0E9RXD4_ANGAN
MKVFANKGSAQATEQRHAPHFSYCYSLGNEHQMKNRYTCVRVSPPEVL